MPLLHDQMVNYVKAIDLSGTPRGLVHQDAAAEAGAVYEDAKGQAQIVGSGIFAFDIGVDAQVREAISSSALLAQLVANKACSAADETLDWFAKYAEVLQNVGWILQDEGWTDYTASGTQAEVNEQLLVVITAALGPGAAALAILTATFSALKAMQPGSSWLTIFSREAQNAKIAHFQVGLVEKGPNDDVFVSLSACIIKAETVITQVLFFKWREANASFDASTQKVSIDRPSLIALGPQIRTKIRAYQADYLSSITDL